MADKPIVCERCRAAEARVELTRVRDGVVTREYYCVRCANAVGVATVAIPVVHPPEPNA